MFGLGGSAAIDITFDDADTRKHVKIPTKNGTIERLPLYKGEDSLVGKVFVNIGKSKKLEHQGIRLEFIGRIETYPNKKSGDFISQARELDPPGFLSENREYTFSFNRFEKPYDTYNGIKARVRYFLKVTIKRKIGGDIAKEKEFAVYLPNVEPEVTGNTKIELDEGGIKASFDFVRTKYHQKDCVVGKIFIQQRDFDIKKIGIEVLREEAMLPASGTMEKEVLAVYEVEDGSPDTDEPIPVRIYLIPFDLSPTYKSVNNRFSVKYYLKLVVLDIGEKRYAKDEEIVIWRK